MKNFTSFCKKHFVSILGAAIVVLILAVGYLGCRRDEIQETITEQRTGSQNAVREAANASNAAVNASAVRQVEDGLRNKIIAPKLDHARRQSQNSKAAVLRAEKEIQNAKTNLSNLNRTIADNCAELGRLFPDTQFEYCRQR